MRKIILLLVFIFNTFLQKGTVYCFEILHKHLEDQLIFGFVILHLLLPFFDIPHRFSSLLNQIQVFLELKSLSRLQFFNIIFA